MVQRDRMWSVLERVIQHRAKDKDKSFVPKGAWKKFVRKQDGYKVYEVDGTWVRTNLCVYFGHGGHEKVHEFIPKGEIWISSHHAKSEQEPGLSPCDCKLDSPNQKVSKEWFDSCALHEITECNHMKKGMIFTAAHQKGLQAEKDLGVLLNPHDDTAAGRAKAKEAESMTPYQQGYADRMEKLAMLPVEAKHTLWKALKHLLGMNEQKAQPAAPQLPSVSAGYDKAVAAPVKQAQSVVPPELGSDAMLPWGHKKKTPPVQEQPKIPPKQNTVAALEKGRKKKESAK